MKRNILSFVLVVFSAALFSQPAPIMVTILNSEPITGITNIQYEFSGPFSSYDIFMIFINLFCRLSGHKIRIEKLKTNLPFPMKTIFCPAYSLIRNRAGRCSRYFY